MGEIFYGLQTPSEQCILILMIGLLHLNLLLHHWHLKYSNIRKGCELKMRRSVKRNGREVRKANLVILNLLLVSKQNIR